MKSVEEMKSLYKCGSDLHIFISEKLPKIRKEYRNQSTSLDKHSDGWEYHGDKIQSINIKGLAYASFSGSY